MEEANLVRGCHCGYCLIEIEDMVQPKTLPCGHIFCLPCLQNDYRVSPKLECITCRQHHQVDDLEALPSYTVCDKEAIPSGGHLEDVEIANPDIKKCDSFCPSHPAEVLKLACSSCLSGLCIECFSAGSKCASGQNHIVMKIDELCNHLKCNLDAGLVKLHERSSSTNELEKNILRLMEEKKKECEQMKAFVDAIADDQMTRIKQESEKLKSEVDDYFNCCAVILEKYITDLKTAKEHLEHLRKEIHTKKQQKLPSYDVISMYSEALTNAEEELDKGFPSLCLPITEVERLEKFQLECRLKERQLIDVLQDLTDPVPTELIFLQAGANLTKHRSSAKWTSLEWTSDDLLLCHTNTREVQCRDQDLNLLFSFPLEYTLAAPFGSRFVLVKFADRECDVDLFTETFRKSQTIVELYQGTVSYSPDRLRISACNERLSILADRKVFVYSEDGTCHLEINCDLSYYYNVSDFKLFSDHMLILSSSSVYKLKCVSGSKREEIITGIYGAVGMTTENGRYVYVTDSTEDMASIHSSAGKLKELKHTELTSVGGLSIKGNKMAVACGKEIKLFKLF